MNIHRITLLVAALLGLAAGTAAFATEAEPPAKPAPPEDKATADLAAADAAAARWVEVKELTYDQREAMFAGLKRLEARADGQMDELKARRAAMKSTANTKDWDFAMKEMGNARAYLRASVEEMTKATPESWAQAKDKVGTAWVRTQEAYAKVKASTTS